MKIPFNKPFQTGRELDYIQDAIHRGKISGNGYYTQLCQEFFEKTYGFQKCLLTTSCTDALEMAAILLNIQPGDEVILPSFTFVSSANAFVLRGAKIVFIDSKEEHPNMDESLLEALITPKTKAIVVVHYGGVPCEMDTILEIAQRHGIFVVEDAAQGIDQYYKGKVVGSIGHLGALSFHETKNIQCGEGGMLSINDSAFIRRAEIIWEKGTDRAAFFRGEIDKYGWVDVGSSFLPSELNAAYLFAQIENLKQIQARRKAIWEDYYWFLAGGTETPTVLSHSYLDLVKSLKCKVESEYQTRSLKDAYTGNATLNSSILNFKLQANAHLFYLLFPDLETRTKYAHSLKEKGILAVFHYQSLHKSIFIQSHQGQPTYSLPHADRFSDCLLRLPLYPALPEDSVQFAVDRLQ